MGETALAFINFASFCLTYIFLLKKFPLLSKTKSWFTVFLISVRVHVWYHIFSEHIYYAAPYQDGKKSIFEVLWIQKLKFKTCLEFFKVRDNLLSQIMEIIQVFLATVQSRFYLLIFNHWNSQL